MELTPREAANQLHELVKQIKLGFDSTAEQISYCEGEAIDLTHGFELLGPDEIDPAELFNQYQTNRRVRRKAKNDNEQWRILYEVITRFGLLEECSRAKREVQSVIKTQAVRSYTVKTREDLQQSFDRAKLMRKII
ncbi:hypothetical protein ACFQ3J_08880 [Paenibacillus provencensis]|uniref:Uncharacterized protein n=1 Tax=Paenibacillus provencensis TaxID=441151 RepID=A0ABW3PUD3_9BACL|nr:hypothetical protein [Paenibacillus sp. MER 78]MCM3128995.1 hypothetical protein [Paenibacillus sp. MER 78]